MSTLQVVTAQITTLSDGTNSTSSTNAIKGSAKAWVNFNGTGTVSTNQTIRASFNVSTVFKNGTGDYTISFTTPLTDANYVPAATANGTTLTNYGRTVDFYYTNAPTTSANRMSVVDYAGNFTDALYFGVAFFGN